MVRTFAEWNPVSSVTQAAREQFANLPPNAPVPGTWALQRPVVYALIWVALILAVFVPLSVQQYKRAAAR